MFAMACYLGLVVSVDSMIMSAVSKFMENHPEFKEKANAINTLLSYGYQPATEEEADGVINNMIGVLENTYYW